MSFDWSEFFLSFLIHKSFLKRLKVPFPCPIFSRNSVLRVPPKQSLAVARDGTGFWQGSETGEWTLKLALR